MIVIVIVAIAAIITIVTAAATGFVVGQGWGRSIVLTRNIKLANRWIRKCKVWIQCRRFLLIPSHVIVIVIAIAIAIAILF